MGKCCRELKVLSECKAQLSAKNGCFVRCKMGKKVAKAEEVFPEGRIQFIGRAVS